MSRSNKKATKDSNVRQSNLFSYFQKTPKQEIPTTDCEEKETITAPEEIANRENWPETGIKKQSPRTPKIPVDISPRKASTSNISTPLLDTDAPDPVVLDTDDEDSRGIGFLSCASSSAPPSKRRRVILSSDEEDEAPMPKLHQEEKEKKNTKNETTPIRRRNLENREKVKKECHDKMDISQDEGMQTPKSKSKNSTQRQQHVSEFTHSFIDSFSFDSTFTSQKDEQREKPQQQDKLTSKVQSLGDPDHFPHLDYVHLKSENIKDAKGRKPSDPDYDPKTLYVPENFLKQQTPGHQQWWKFKGQHFDTILLFKVGKFYELYHMDAVIAVENLGLTFMRGKYAHCGFPEIGYARFADQLINRGYKVARIEQTETPDQLSERQKDKVGSQKEKVVRRELCRITTLGTKTYGVLDGTDSRDMDGTTDPNPCYLMALIERPQQSTATTRFGICFVDCTVGKFKLSEFNDDHGQSNLRTLLAHNYPVQILFDRGSLSSKTMDILNTMLANVPKESLIGKKQFHTAEKALTLLSTDDYLGTNIADWPLVLREYLMDQNVAIPQPRPDKQLALSALGAMLWYLKECLIDVDIVTMRQFEEYMPPSIDSLPMDKLDSEILWKDKYMVLDSVALLNLHILPGLSSKNRTPALSDKSIANFSLFNTINHCQTAFGKRLLRQWVSAPSCDQDVILGRQKAIEWLTREEMRSHIVKWAELLRKVPDLERLFQRIHTIGLKYRADTLHGHPDSRAQMFESHKYNRRKIKDLLIMLDGLEQVQRLMRIFSQTNEQAQENVPPLLLKCLGTKIDEMEKDLNFFKKAFDHENALQSGVIHPHKGVDKEYDDACEAIEQCKANLDSFLAMLKKKLKCSNIKFIGTGRNQQLEVPETISPPADFDYSSKRKGYRRYTTTEMQNLVAELNDAEAKRGVINVEVTRRVFADFDLRKDKWAAIVYQIATFDCLLALTLYAQSSTEKMCFPNFDFESTEPFLAIQRGFYPSLIDPKVASNNFNYIPNSCHLGINEYGEQASALTMLLTGPNMGGKSTYMRQIASLVVLAQIGSMVPAETMRLTPVDRVFCRIGASDRLAAGQSTFYVELAETNTIIRQASRHSIVLIDELGRGTSTHDGTAIACATLKYIANKIRCRTLFSTHYHTICKFVAKNSNICFAHMACMVENPNTEDPTMETITFLYTLTDGVCDKSYGFYTAKMAGIDVEVVRKAFEASRMLEEQQKHDE